MVRSYFRLISIVEMVISPKANELIDTKIAEAIDGVQKLGGTIVNAHLSLAGITGTYQFFLLYEDNDNYEIINDYLHNKVFCFGRYLKYEK